MASTIKMREQLEDIIDSISVTNILDVIAEACSEKADHIRESYSDDELADEWDDASEKIANIATEINV